VRLEGEIALLLSDSTAGGATLVIDPANGNVIVQQGSSLFVPSATPFTGAVSTPGGVGTTFCPSIVFSCEQLQTCEQARACLPFNQSLDGDADGIPCENLCGN
jgi:hypothetical protein